MVETGNAVGRAGAVSFVPNRVNAEGQVVIVGLKEFIREISKLDKDVQSIIRKASVEAAKTMVSAATLEAAFSPRPRQALEIMKAMKAKSDRIPTVKLSEKQRFRSQSRPTVMGSDGRRKQRIIRAGDVFFGAEFGGRGKAGRRTNQFLPHRGKAGYFFWPSVRKNRDGMAKNYLDAIEEIFDRLSK